MSDPSRPASQPRRPTPRNAVPIARGYGRDALARVIQALGAAGVEYEIEEETPGESQGSWNVRVPITMAPRAIAALAALGAEAAHPAPSVPPPRAEVGHPEPLFQSSTGWLLRALAIALCFGLAVWLALRGL